MYVLEGQKWPTTTITWSVAQFNYPGDTDGVTNGPLFSNPSAFTAAFEALVRQAMATWAAVTNLTFVEVGDSPTEATSAGIRFGFAKLDNAPFNALGLTNFPHVQGNTFTRDVQVQLEDPAQDSLIALGNGDFTFSKYQNTRMSQVVLHEIGHALGLGHDNDPGSQPEIMYGAAGLLWNVEGNTLGPDDIAGIQALYGQPNTAGASPNNTVATGPGQVITDARGNAWSIVNGQVAVNGVSDPSTSNVIELAYENGRIWQENSAHLWWGKTLSTDLWSPDGGTSVSPVPAAPAAPAPSAPPVPQTSPVMFSGQDTSTQSAFTDAGTVYQGPVAGLQYQFIRVTADSLNVASAVPNVFIHTGSGTDAINVSQAGGNNVLDGGTGSNFLVGGNGTDTFFVDDRGATADIWSTIVNFHSGDATTVWGIGPNGTQLTWVDNQGAAGYAGLTLHAAGTGQPTASFTLGGYSSADLSNGRLAVVFGTDPSSGSGYLYVHAN